MEIREGWINPYKHEENIGGMVHVCKDPYCSDHWASDQKLAC